MKVAAQQNSYSAADLYIMEFYFITCYTRFIKRGIGAPYTFDAPLPPLRITHYALRITHYLKEENKHAYPYPLSDRSSSPGLGTIFFRFKQ